MISLGVILIHYIFGVFLFTRRCRNYNNILTQMGNLHISSVMLKTAFMETCRYSCIVLLIFSHFKRFNIQLDLTKRKN